MEFNPLKYIDRFADKHPYIALGIATTVLALGISSGRPTSGNPTEKKDLTELVSEPDEVKIANDSTLPPSGIPAVLKIGKGVFSFVKYDNDQDGYLSAEEVKTIPKEDAFVIFGTGIKAGEVKYADALDVLAQLEPETQSYFLDMSDMGHKYSRDLAARSVSDFANTMLAYREKNFNWEETGSVEIARELMGWNAMAYMSGLDKTLRASVMGEIMKIDPAFGKKIDKLNKLSTKHGSYENVSDHLKHLEDAKLFQEHSVGFR